MGEHIEPEHVEKCEFFLQNVHASQFRNTSFFPPILGLSTPLCIYIYKKNPIEQQKKKKREKYMSRLAAFKQRSLVSPSPSTEGQEHFSHLLKAIPTHYSPSTAQQLRSSTAVCIPPTHTSKRRVSPPPHVSNLSPNSYNTCRLKHNMFSQGGWTSHHHAPSPLLSGGEGGGGGASQPHPTSSTRQPE